jgi:hypothetical protein
MDGHLPGLPGERQVAQGDACHAGLVVSASAHVQLGDVATWVGGIATAAALLLTYFLLRITRQEQMAQRAEQHKAQARLVSAWSDQVQPLSDGGLHSVTVTLQNSSEEPIFAVMVAVGVEWSRRTKVDYTELDLSYVIRPKYKHQHTASLKLGRLLDGSYESSPPVEVIFNDASGDEKFWWRDRYGGLTQLNEKLPSLAAKHFFGPPANPA